MEVKCKDCEERYVGCHDKCEYYKAYKQYLEERKAQERRKRMTEYYVPNLYKRKSKKKNR